MTHSIRKISNTIALGLSGCLLSIAATAQPIVVKSVSLKTLSLDELGTLTDKNGGIGSNIWEHSDRHYMEGLLTFLPNEVSSPTLNELKKRLLLTSAIPPESHEEKPMDLFSLRLKKLALSGESDAVSDMLNLAPTERRTEEMQQIRIAALLNNDAVKDACKSIHNYVAVYDSVEWKEWLALCQSYEGDGAAAKLGIRLIKESDHKLPEGFQGWMTELSGKAKSKKAGLAKWEDAMNKTVLRLPEFETSEPELPNSGDFSFDAKANSWRNGMRSASENDKAAALLKAYDIIRSLGGTISVASWQKVALYAAHYGDQKTKMLLSSALPVSAGRGDKGEVIALTLIIAGNQKLTDIPHPIINDMVSALMAAGYEREARSLAAEALF